MKKLLFLFFIIIILVVSCTKNKITTLNVKNNTNHNIWIKINSGEQETILPNSNKTHTWTLSSGGLSGDEQKNVKLEYNGYTVFKKDTTIVLTAGDYKTFTINPEGGCIKIINDSEYFTIEKVFISPSDSLYWGDDVLNGTIPPQDSVSWTCSPGLWDVKVIDDFGEVFTKMENEVLLDQVVRLFYTGFKKSKTLKKEGKIKIYNIEKNNWK